jgi:aminopeptidase N
MEHQTIIAYGANFSRTAMSGGDMGFDSLHHHELSHEWWGNLVTNFNWNDMWLHEGFGTYMQPLYIEYLSGREAYLAQFAHGHRFQNAIPVAPREILSSSGIYSTDIYYKGSWVLHTLRYLIGEEPFFTALRRMAYPTPEMESVTDGSQTRFATTDDFVRLVNQISGRDLSWFFEAYIRRAPLPSLRMTRSGTRVELAWSASGLPFPMPIDVWVDGEARRVEMPDGRALLTVPEIAEVLIDPTNLVLRKENERPPRQRN